MKQEVARKELNTLKLVGMNINAHIARFEELVNKAGFNLNAEENMYRFLKTFNNRPNILRRIMDPEAPVGYKATREKARCTIRSQLATNSLLQHLLNQSDQPFRPSQPQRQNNCPFRNNQGF
jgi:hypothetical protein